VIITKTKEGFGATFPVNGSGVPVRTQSSPLQ
jgi:hypothetical protein